ncbi:MAG: PEP-CTERM sorting domain-containing protein [Planctomycetota bacterium]
MTPDLSILVEYFAGDPAGTNTAYMVIDFEETGGESYGFGYRYDGSVTAEDLIVAVVAEGALDWDFGTSGGFGTFINNFFYEGEVGNPSSFWRYEQGVLNLAGDAVDWTTSGVGISSAVLSDGDFVGWYNSFADSSVKPALPIPEPASSAVVLGLAGLMLRRRRG